MLTETSPIPAAARVGALLPPSEFAAVVAAAPLVSIDLIVSDCSGAVLFGLRNNPPAKGRWFVPGGRVRKNETLANALLRLYREELGWTAVIGVADFSGVYEHFYDTDFRDTAGTSTHYVVLAYRLRVERASLRLPNQLPRAQHTVYQWLQPQQILEQPDIHPYARAYFLK